MTDPYSWTPPYRVPVPDRDPAEEPAPRPDPDDTRGRPTGRPAPAPTATELTTVPYHRLATAWPRARWWRPLLGVLLAALIYVALFLATGLVLELTTPGAMDVLDRPASDALSSDLYDPLEFGLTMGSLVLMLPAALLGFRLVGCRPVGLLSSVVGRLRWGWLVRCCGPAAVVLLVALGISTLADLAYGELRTAPIGAPVLFVLILVLTPFQAAAEEYAFRGVLMQTIGAWLRHPAWAIVLPIPLFVLGHAYDVSGQMSVAVFAAVTAWITWRTGGLEAAIALHVVNNLAALLFGAAGFADLNATETGWAAALVSAAVPVTFAIWVDRIWRRRVGPS